MANESLTEALGLLQEATRALVAAHKAIEEHNIAIDCHEDIRKLVRGLMESDVIYTNDQIRELATEAIKSHTELDIEHSHTGFVEYKTSVEEQMASLALRVESLEKWRDTGINDAAKTDLQKELQDVENRYAVILASLQDALMEAEGKNNIVLTEEIKNSIRTTLEQKNAELMQVITNWQLEHRQPTEDD